MGTGWVPSSVASICSDADSNNARSSSARKRVRIELADGTKLIDGTASGGQRVMATLILIFVTKWPLN